MEIGENTFEENEIEFMPQEEPNNDEKPKFKEGMKAKRVSTFFNKNNDVRGINQE